MRYCGGKFGGHMAHIIKHQWLDGGDGDASGITGSDSVDHS